MKEKTIRIIAIRPGAAPVEESLGNELPAMQKLVGGYIEAHAIGDGLRVICDEDANMKKVKPPVVAVFEGLGPIRGPCFICRQRGEHFASVKEGDLAAVKARHQLWEPEG